MIRLLVSLAIAFALIPLLSASVSAQRSGEILNNELQVMATVSGNVVEVSRTYRYAPIRGLSLTFEKDGRVRNTRTGEVYCYVIPFGNEGFYLAGKDRNRFSYSDGNAVYAYKTQERIGTILKGSTYLYKIDGKIVMRWKDIPSYIPIVTAFVGSRYF